MKLKLVNVGLGPLPRHPHLYLNINLLPLFLLENQLNLISY